MSDKRKILKKHRRKIGDIIYTYRKQGLSYKKIAEKFSKKGFEISESSARKIGKEEFALRNEEDPVLARIVDITDEELYNARQRRLSSARIAEEYGGSISISTVYNRCVAIYEKLGEDMPKAKYKKREPKKRKKLPEDKIYNWKKEGYTILQIKEKLFKECGIDVSTSLIRSRCKEIFKAKGEEMPNQRHINLPEEQVYIWRKNGCNKAQIKEKLLEEYGIDVSEGFVYTTCKAIFEKKGEEEPDLRKTKKSRKSNKSRMETER